MKENKLTELSMDFSVDIVNLVKHLKTNHESIISNQIGRSGTSIGANIFVDNSLARWYTLINRKKIGDASKQSCFDAFVLGRTKL